MTQPSAPGRILCFGEIMARLNPPEGELLAQARTLTLRPGGAEANVAASLARLGAPAAVATVLPDNPLGHGVRDELRRAGVDTRAIQYREGRMGLYFVTPGAVRRPSEILYDRADSAFVRHADTAFDWPALLEGAEWLHVSGVTPAVGPNGTAAALAAVAAAKAAGVKVSFDGNFRAKLWSQWKSDPPGVLSRLFGGASLAFADDRDFALVLGRTFAAPDAGERRREAAGVAFRTWPNLQRIACTLRLQSGVADQTLSAVMFTRDGDGLAETHAPAITLSGVIDRVGGGDSFAAGVIYGLWSGLSDHDALAFGLTASGLKHSVHGDFSPFTADDVRSAMSVDGFDIRR